MSSQLTAKQHPRPYRHVAAMIHPRGLSTGCRAWRGRSACCGRMSGCPALSRAFRLLGLRRGLGVGVGTWSGGEHHCRRLIDAERAIDHVESRTSASRVTLREIYANRIPLPDPACRGLVVDTADQLIAAGQAAEQQPRSHARNKRNEPGRTRHWSNASQTSRCQPLEGVRQPARKKMRPRKGQADIGVWGLSGDTRSRSIDLRLRRPHEMSSRSGGRRRPHTPRLGRAETPDHEPNASRWWHRGREEQSWLSLRAGLQCRPCCMTWPRRRRRCG
jgi:hypothetical protein